MNALAMTQAAMRGWLLDGDRAIAPRVAGDVVAHRLRIYADAYRLRLLEVLGNDFPATRAVLGEAAFAALAVDYLHAHPSTRPSARHVGHAFAGWLATRRDVSAVTCALAAFEWMQGECFDAADMPVLGIDQVAALPADAWPALRLRLLPSTRLLTLRCNAPAVVDAHARRLPLPTLRAATPAHWLLWRHEADVHWRRLDADEATALRAITAGEAFAGVCARLDHLHAGGALRAASLLKRWLADGLLAAN